MSAAKARGGRPRLAIDQPFSASLSSVSPLCRSCLTASPPLRGREKSVRASLSPAERGREIEFGLLSPAQWKREMNFVLLSPTQQAGEPAGPSPLQQNRTACTQAVLSVLSSIGCSRQLLVASASATSERLPS